jgi:hypothetical protein
MLFWLLLSRIKFPNSSPLTLSLPVRIFNFDLSWYQLLQFQICWNQLLLGGGLFECFNEHLYQSLQLLFTKILIFNHLLILCLGPQHDGLLAESEGGDDSTKKSIKQTQEKISHPFLCFNFGSVALQLSFREGSEKEIQNGRQWNREIKEGRQGA